MSKSLGNVVDPVETIQEYGSDALRFTLATGKFQHGCTLEPAPCNTDMVGLPLCSPLSAELVLSWAAGHWLATCSEGSTGVGWAPAGLHGAGCATLLRWPQKPRAVGTSCQPGKCS